MSHYPEIILFSWFIPAIQLIIPLLMLAAYPFVLLSRRIIARSHVRETISQPVERRECNRITIEKTGAFVRNRQGDRIGDVINISSSGICISQSSDRSQSVEEEMVLTVGKDFEAPLLLRPIWENMQHNRKSIGMAILNTPRGWPEFLASAA